MKIVDIHFTSVPSTNKWAMQHLEEFDKTALTVIAADAQTEGVGRQGKKWLSPSNQNLYVTFAFFVNEEKDPLSLTHVLALSTIEVLNQLGIVGKIKWPNDILVEGKKIAGILCETKVCREGFGVVIGIGININMKEEELAKIDQNATSVFNEKGEESSLGIVLATLKGRFREDLELFLKRGFEPFLPKFKESAYPNWEQQ